MTMRRFIIPGTVRSKKNSKRIIRAGGFPKVIPSKAYVKWEEAFRNELALLCLQGRIMPTNKPVHVSATFFYKGPEPDLSGCMESLADACEGILWENDKQIVCWDGSGKVHDKGNPRIEFSYGVVEQGEEMAQSREGNYDNPKVRGSC